MSEIYSTTKANNYRSSLHHVEFGVHNGLEAVERFVSKFDFNLVARRKCRVAVQWLLTKGHIRFLVTELTSLDRKQIEEDPFVNIWFDIDKLSTSNSFKIIQDSVFNIAIEVHDIVKCVNTLTKSGVKCCKTLQRFESLDGDISTATFESCVGNLKHTLVQRDSFTNTFLPGFDPIQEGNYNLSVNLDYNDNVNKVRLHHVDHITLVTDIGTSHSVLDWYEKHFGMSRFLINREDNDSEGFVINGEDIGIRLMAFEYWKCAEVGLVSQNKKTDGFKFVIAEALPSHGVNQVSTFLTEHGGPGVQHIGLHTSDIVGAVSALSRNGVLFTEVPSTYYTEVGKLDEIQMVNADATQLRENGILIDVEEDSNQDDEDDHKQRYLMQKFTKPIFKRDTFFLEIIQRFGAEGFGSGNITALWRSVQAYMDNSTSGS